MKVIAYMLGYLALLVPSLFFALCGWMDIADPPTLYIPHSFWLTGCGQFIRFGLAFVVPALIVLCFGGVMKLVCKRDGKDSHALA